MTESLKDLYKISTKQIYLLWRNFASSLMVVVAMIIFSKLLPPICAPIVSTVACVVYYFMVYNSAYSDTETCVVVPYTMFNVTLLYTIVLVVLNLLNIWSLIDLPTAFVFFDGYIIPSLLYSPIGVIVTGIIYLRRHRLSICAECKLHNGSPLERGRAGVIFSHESELQLRHLLFIFSIVSVAFWFYYKYEFNDINVTNRDSFTFSWFFIIVMIIEVITMGMRYYNLYLDLKENNELVNPGDNLNNSARTYFRFYVICEDNIYLANRESDDFNDQYPETLDTPFIEKRIMKNVPDTQVQRIVENVTGVKGGMLRFFFGRRVVGNSEHRIMRYFYFLPGEVSSYPSLGEKGEWLSSEKFKTLYNTRPFLLNSTLLSDMSRLATIVVTSKIFDETGERRNKLMHYRPSFSFSELRNTDLDFQDETWMRVAMYNSDQRFFRIKRWLRQGERRRKKMPYNNSRMY